MAEEVKPRTKTPLRQAQGRLVRGETRSYRLDRCYFMSKTDKKILIIEDDPSTITFAFAQVKYGARLPYTSSKFKRWQKQRRKF